MDHTYSAVSARYRNEWITYLSNEQWDFWITLNFNQQRSFTTASAALMKFEARLNRSILGKNWRKKPMDQRVQFIAFPEHPETNFHYHVFIRTPKAERFEALATKHWRTLVPGGQAHVKTVEGDENWKEVSGYSTKDQYQAQLMENMVLSGQYSSDRSS